LLQGDFGTSIYYRIPAFDLYVQRLPPSCWPRWQWRFRSF
jgi:hypothetical protein